MNTHSAILSLENAPAATWRVGEDIRIVHGVYPNFPLPSEFHFRDFVMVYLKSGVASGKWSGEEVRFTAPCMIIIQPTNVLEFGAYANDVDAVALSYSHVFTNRLNIMQRFQLSEILYERPSLALDTETQAQLERYIARVIDLGKNPRNPFLDEALLHLTLSFFYGIGYNYYQTERMAAHAQQIVTEFMQLVEKHGAEEHYIDFYATKLHLSPKYLQRIIRDLTERTAYMWIEDVIIRRAKQMLREGNLTLQQIAGALRFCDQSYFGAYFKRITGETPMGYRKRYNQTENQE